MYIYLVDRVGDIYAINRLIYTMKRGDRGGKVFNIFMKIFNMPFILAYQ